MTVQRPTTSPVIDGALATDSFEPINLDDPNARPLWCDTCNRWGLHVTDHCRRVRAASPELARWRELAAADTTVVHNGDVSKVAEVTRPSWSDPDLDIIGSGVTDSMYRSYPAAVSASLMRGVTDDDHWLPVFCAVSAKLFADGRPAVAITVESRSDDGKGSRKNVSLTVAEAHELAGLLLAAADLAVSD